MRASECVKDVGNKENVFPIICSCRHDILRLQANVLFLFSVFELFKVKFLIFNEIAGKCRLIEFEFEVTKSVGKGESTKQRSFGLRVL